MYAYGALLIGAQAVLAWTFNSHIGGEEQALFGLLDHDGTPSWKVDEFARIASEFKQLSRFGFPRYTRPRGSPLVHQRTQRAADRLAGIEPFRAIGHIRLLRVEIVEASFPGGIPEIRDRGDIGHIAPPDGIELREPLHR